jgi:hypothetical protein
MDEGARSGSGTEDALIEPAAALVCGSLSTPDSLSRRCIYRPWLAEVKILQLRRNIEEIIFYFSALIDR